MKPTRTEFKTVETHTLAGLKLAERLVAEGWQQVRVGLFHTVFSRRASK
jgi:hypothetical protein